MLKEIREGLYINPDNIEVVEIEERQSRGMLADGTYVEPYPFYIVSISMGSKEQLSQRFDTKNEALAFIAKLNGDAPKGYDPDGMITFYQETEAALLARFYDLGGQFGDVFFDEPELYKEGPDFIFRFEMINSETNQKKRPRLLHEPSQGDTVEEVVELFYTWILKEILSFNE